MKKKIVSLLSGGINSTVLTTLLKNQGNNVHTLSLYYGQRHLREVAHAADIARKLGVPNVTVATAALGELMSGLLVTPEKEIPPGYSDDEMMRTIVPGNRNMILISIAIAYAMKIEAQEVNIGTSEDNHIMYLDSRPSFIEAMDYAAEFASAKTIEVKAPFNGMRKQRIVELGVDIGAPMEMTWTCYKGMSHPCGVCPACTDRRLAFKAAGITDQE